MIRMDIDGLEETLMAFDKYGDDGVREASKAVRATVEKVRIDAIRSIQRGPKTGILYERDPGQNLSATHRASAPGEAPANDSGDLISSAIAKSSGVTGTVTFGEDYASALEYGTFRMAPRPYLGPAVRNNEGYFVERLEKGLEKAQKRFES